MAEARQKVVSVLLVCTGNICRSPTVEGVLRKKLAEAAPGKKVRIESAGMEDYHAGEPPDPRAQRRFLQPFDPLRQLVRVSLRVVHS